MATMLLSKRGAAPKFSQPEHIAQIKRDGFAILGSGMDVANAKALVKAHERYATNNKILNVAFAAFAAEKTDRIAVIGWNQKPETQEAALQVAFPEDYEAE